MRARENHMEKPRKIWWIVGISLMLLTLILGTATAISIDASRKSRAAVSQNYERALYDLGDNMHNIEINLSKLMAANDGTYSAVLLTDMYSQATAAGKSLDGLPVDWEVTRETATFLNKVADFSASYQKSILGGRDTSSFRTNLGRLYDTAKTLGASVGESMLAASQGKLRFSSATTRKPFEYRTDQTIRHDTLEYPELIYDGPFSDGRKEDEFTYLAGLENCDEACARRVALAALGTSFEEEKITVTLSQAREPMYDVSLYGKDVEAYASISRRGGKLVTLTVSRPVGASMLGREQAQNKAKEYAARLGYDTEPVWYAASDGVAYVNLAPMPNGIVCYPDLVKVKVALDNGDVLGIDAKNYCLNHIERSGKPRMNATAVTTLVDEGLDIDSVRGAYIPTETGGERLCYEVAATMGDRRYFVYLDGTNGETVQIMRVIDGGEQGTLVL